MIRNLQWWGFLLCQCSLWQCLLTIFKLLSNLMTLAWQGQASNPGPPAYWLPCAVMCGGLMNEMPSYLGIFLLWTWTETGHDRDMSQGNVHTHAWFLFYPPVHKVIVRQRFQLREDIVQKPLKRLTFQLTPQLPTFSHTKNSKRFRDVILRNKR